MSGLELSVSNANTVPGNAVAVFFLPTSPNGTTKSTSILELGLRSKYNCIAVRL
jgi:hypothetical protein